MYVLYGWYLFNSRNVDDIRCIFFFPPKFTIQPSVIFEHKTITRFLDYITVFFSLRYFPYSARRTITLGIAHSCLLYRIVFSLCLWKTS